MAGVPEEREHETEEKGSEAGGATEGSQDAASALECPICLQQCMHPVELPCHHVFCFLCIKGVAMQGPNSKCAICRSPIPYSVLTNPLLKDVSQLLKEPKLPNGYQWYYESRSGGWWQYDERTMQDLERAFLSEQPTCQLLVAGHVYTVDFKHMIQFRTNNRNVSRRIKRAMNLDKRGIAGLRIAGSNTGAGSSGGAGDGSPPPPPGAASSSRRRRVNSSAASSVQPSPATGQSSAVSGNCSVVSSNAGSANPPASHNFLGNVPRQQRDEFSDSDDESLDEDEDYNSDYSDVDEDMELGEEEEALIGDDSDERETEDEEEYDTRDGARAPTRRSDRSNSSNNQTPPPPSGGISNGGSGRTYSPNSNGRGSRGARSGRSSGGGGGGRSGNGNSGSNSRTAPVGLSSPQSPPASSNSNVLAPLFFNRCNLEDVGQRCNVNVSNNNIYLELDAHRIIDQSVSFTVTQSFCSISNSTNSVKVAFDKRSTLNQEEYL